MSERTTRRLTVVLLLTCLAVSAWWTSQPRTARQAVGWCVEKRGQDVRFLRCAARPFGSYGKVVGASPVAADLMGEPPFGPACPLETDEVILAPLPPGPTTFPPGPTPLLCLDTKPGDGNTRG